MSLTPAERKRGIVAASTGNHGRAVAHCLNQLYASGIIYVPIGTVQAKVKAIEQLGVEVRYHGNDTVEAEVEARRFASACDLIYVSPYNDLQVIHGQGSIGVELENQLSPIDAVFVALGGGGLISGVGAYLKSVYPEAKIIGCSPENSQVMIQSVKAGRILDLSSLPTLSDGTAGGLEAGTITFDLCRRYVDDYMTVTEGEIEEALRFFISGHHMLIEGAAAVAIASYMKMCGSLKRKNVVIIICGANIDMAVLKEIL
jgi:threonine dehydratase